MLAAVPLSNRSVLPFAADTTVCELKKLTQVGFRG